MSRYTCHTDNLGPASRTSKMIVQDGYCRRQTCKKSDCWIDHAPFMVERITEWQPIACGHITSKIDSQCDGCKHQRTELPNAD